MTHFHACSECGVVLADGAEFCAEHPRATVESIQELPPSTSIRVDKNLDLVMITTGPGAGVGMLDRELVREHAAAVRRALIVAASEHACSVDDLNVGIAGGTLSYAEVRDL